MPYHVGRPSRRQLLRRSLGAGLGLMLPGCASFPVFHGMPGPGLGESPTPERWALISDPHISADPDATVGPVNMADHLRQAVAAALAPAAGAGGAAAAPPAGLIVNGDCALESGYAGDYATFADLLVRPAAAAGVPVHLTVGNHDHRERFFDALCGCAGPARVAGGRCASVVAGRYANWFLLDTLDEGHLMAGTVGSRQLDWLRSALRRHDDRPALVVGHHPLDPEAGLIDGNTSLLDAPALWGVLTAFPHVKAYVFGHTHRWYVSRRQGVYLVNLPSTAYTFDEGQPHGWVEMWLGSRGARLRVRHVGGEAPGAGASDAAELCWG